MRNWQLNKDDSSIQWSHQSCLSIQINDRAVVFNNVATCFASVSVVNYTLQASERAWGWVGWSVCKVYQCYTLHSISIQCNDMNCAASCVCNQYCLSCNIPEQRQYTLISCRLHGCQTVDSEMTWIVCTGATTVDYNCQPISDKLMVQIVPYDAFKWYNRGLTSSDPQNTEWMQLFVPPFLRHCIPTPRPELWC